MRKLIEDIPVALDNIPTADDENKIFVSGATSCSILDGNDEPLDPDTARRGHYKAHASYAHAYIIDLNKFDAKEYVIDSEM